MERRLIISLSVGVKKIINVPGLKDVEGDLKVMANLDEGEGGIEVKGVRSEEGAKNGATFEGPAIFSASALGVET